MKKTCYVLLCALLPSLAPTTFAAEGEVVGASGQLFDQLISFFVEIGEELPPGGAPAPSGEPESGEPFPPTVAPEAESEAGNFFPPGG